MSAEKGPCAFAALLSCIRLIDGRAQAFGIHDAAPASSVVEDVQAFLNAKTPDDDARLKALAHALWRVANEAERLGGVMWAAAQVAPAPYDRRGTVDCHRCENGWKPCVCVGPDDGDCMCGAVAGC